MQENDSKLEPMPKELDFSYREFRKWLNTWDPEETLGQVIDKLVAVHWGCPIDVFVQDKHPEFTHVGTGPTGITCARLGEITASYQWGETDWRCHFVNLVDSEGTKWAEMKLKDLKKFASKAMRMQKEGVDGMLEFD